MNVLPQVTKLKRIALDLLFPQWCVGCGSEGRYICQKCGESLSVISLPVCLRCGKPLSMSELCPACVEWDSAIDGIRSPFVFKGVIRQAIHELKYRNLRALAAEMADLLYEYVSGYPVPGDVLIPVPLHKKRLRERGYNQSVLLARELGKLMGISVDAESLAKMIHNTPQARTTSVNERRDNVAGVFSCRGDSLRGKSVILLDDVTTSGATLNACAESLKTAGVSSVWGLTMAIEL